MPPRSTPAARTQARRPDCSRATAGTRPRSRPRSARRAPTRAAARYEIQLSDAELPTVPDDDLELWLIEPDAQGKPKDIAPVSLISSSKPGVYTVPAGPDPLSHYR